jgi:hypothetical protein
MRNENYVDGIVIAVDISLSRPVRVQCADKSPTILTFTGGLLARTAVSDKLPRGLLQQQ